MQQEPLVLIKIYGIFMILQIEQWVDNEKDLENI